MKKLFLSILLCALCSALFSQNVSKYDSLMKVSKSQRTSGIVGCVTGPVLLGAGIGLAVLGTFETNNTVALVEIIGGGLIAGCGAALTVLGPISLVKSKKTKAAAQQYKGTAYMLPPMLISNAGYTGLGISMQFRF